MADNSIEKQISLVVFGGTFDPPHQGHLDCINAAAKRFPQAKILVTPTPEPPEVAGVTKAPVVVFEERLRLLNLLVDESPFLSRVIVSPLEKSLSHPHYTVGTLRAIKDKLPNENIVFLLGLDQLRVFDKWFEPEKILSQAALAVVRRDHVGGAYGGNTNEITEKLMERMHYKLSWINSTTAKISKDGCVSAVFLIKDQLSIASSSMIRQLLANKQPLPAGWVPQSLAEVLKSRRYYEQVKQ